VQSIGTNKEKEGEFIFQVMKAGRARGGKGGV
jgi:hypothetical protein